MTPFLNAERGKANRWKLWGAIAVAILTQESGGQAYGADGRLLAVLFGYACHNTTMAFNQWCGDYAGFAQQTLELSHTNATAMFFMGCGGDQNPYPRRTPEFVQHHGRQSQARQVAQAGILGILRGPGQLDAGILRVPRIDLGARCQQRPHAGIVRNRILVDQLAGPDAAFITSPPGHMQKE